MVFSHLSLAAALLVVSASTARAAQAPKASPATDLPVTASQQPAGEPTDPILRALRRDESRKDPPWKSFGEVTKDAEVVNGLFTAYLKRDNVYLSVRRDQLERDFLLVAQLSQGVGELGLDGGSSLRSDLVRFHRAGDRLELWVVNPHFAARPGTPMARTVEYSFGHSIAQSFPIATMRDTSEILIDVAPFFLSDWADFTAVFQAVAAQRKLGGSTGLDRERSSFQSLKLFPTNLEAEVRLTYQANRNLGIESVSDYRWIPVGVHYSLLELPAVPMRPRYADDRVGYFISATKDFSRDTAETFFVRYINRWRLEKKDPTLPVSEPVKPIVYYIDRTVPLEWRRYVRAGILEWNKAFDTLGYRNAIQVFDAPPDSLWNAEDARYSTVRWTATNRSVYAIGPTNVDPRTGEILNADILISASWIQTWRGDAGQYVGPEAAVRSVFIEDSLLRAGDGASLGRLCSFGSGVSRQGILVRSILAAGGLIPPGSAAPNEYIGQALKELVMHEVGHTLGLRHNFRGSAGLPADKLGDRAYTATNGLGVSVMDYTPPAVAPDPTKQGDYYSRTIGSYDRWAISYGYQPLQSGPVAPQSKGAADEEAATWTPEHEVNALHTIASLASLPSHAYASDEDAGFGGFGIDPEVSRYDQTDDALGWARDRVTLINGLFDSLENRVVAPGQDYTRLRTAFADLLTDRWYATLVTTKYVGGATTARDHRGDPGERPAFVTIPAGKQREALGFITEAALGDSAYHFSPELLSKLAPERWMHWGASIGTRGRSDFPLHAWATAQQASVLNALLDPVVLSRIGDAELRAAANEDVVTIPELFNTLTAALWAEAGFRADGKHERVARNTSSIRRDVQRLYLASLSEMIVNPAPGTPEDARTVARMTLTELGRQIDRVLARPVVNLDLYTKAHLVDSRERIKQALGAQLVQTPRSSK